MKEPLVTQCVSTLYKLWDKSYLLDGRNGTQIRQQNIFQTKHVTFTVRCFFVYDILLCP